MNDSYKKSSTIDEQELKKFEKISEEWWKTDGKFSALHKFNPVRLQYIKNKLETRKSTESNNPLKIIDIGCGGGLISEPLAEAGFNVTGIDALKQNIKIAKYHSDKKEIKNLNYKHILPEEMPNETYDAVLLLEILEHVKDPYELIKIAAEKLDEDGLLFISTINKTYKSLTFAKFFAEYVLKWVDKGTHDWNKFIKPSQIKEIGNEFGLEITDIKGIKFNLLKNKWELSYDCDINYILTAKKR